MGNGAMSIVEWYAGDVAAGTQGDPVGAAGFAGRTRPLALALLRLFVGDDHAAKDLIPLMSQMLVGKAFRTGLDLRQMAAEDIAKAVLAWHRDGVCKPCFGRGYLQIDGAPSLSDHACPSCKGSRRAPLESAFRVEHAGLARWLASEIDREQAIAGKEAMKRLAPRFQL